MQVAEILSDLTSLRVCEHHDALTLVTVNERLALEQPQSEDNPGLEENSQSGQDSTPAQAKQQSDDLRRAKELVDLHYEMKARHGSGTVDEELARAREDVSRVLRELTASRML